MPILHPSYWTLRSGKELRPVAIESHTMAPPTSPSHPISSLECQDTPHDMGNSPMHPEAASTLELLTTQVQQLLENQASSQQQMQHMYVSHQAVQQQLQVLIGCLLPQPLPLQQHCYE